MVSLMSSRGGGETDCTTARADEPEGGLRDSPQKFLVGNLKKDLG